MNSLSIEEAKLRAKILARNSATSAEKNQQAKQNKRTLNKCMRCGKN